MITTRAFTNLITMTLLDYYEIINPTISYSVLDTIGIIQPTFSQISVYYILLMYYVLNANGFIVVSL